jgi:hypothetical protein
MIPKKQVELLNLICPEHCSYSPAEPRSWCEQCQVRSKIKKEFSRLNNLSNKENKVDEQTCDCPTWIGGPGCSCRG